MRSKFFRLLTAAVVDSELCRVQERQRARIRRRFALSTCLIPSASRVPATAAPSRPRAEWRFDEVDVRHRPPGPLARNTRGWEAGPGVAELAVREGRLVGRSTTDAPIIHLERTSGFEVADALHGIEIRMRAVRWRPTSACRRPRAPTLNLAAQADAARTGAWTMQSPLQAGDEFQTYFLMPLAPTLDVAHAAHRDSSHGRGRCHVCHRVHPQSSAAASILHRFRPEWAGRGLSEVYRESLVGARAGNHAVRRAACRIGRGSTSPLGQSRTGPLRSS